MLSTELGIIFNSAELPSELELNIINYGSASPVFKVQTSVNMSRISGSV